MIATTCISPPSCVSSLAHRDNARAKQQRRKERKAKEADRQHHRDEHSVESLGWTAIREIAKVLRQRKTLMDEGFVQYLSRLKSEYSNIADFSDTSPLIQGMLTSNPPGLETLPDYSWETDEKVYMSGGLESLYELRVKTLKFRGARMPELFTWLHRRAQPYADRVFCLLRDGQQACMHAGRIQTQRRISRYPQNSEQQSVPRGTPCDRKRLC